MNWDQIEGKWKQSVGKVKEKWGKLTDDDLTAINGQRDQLIGKIQERVASRKARTEGSLGLSRTKKTARAFAAWRVPSPSGCQRSISHSKLT